MGLLFHLGPMIPFAVVGMVFFARMVEICGKLRVE